MPEGQFKLTYSLDFLIDMRKLHQDLEGAIFDERDLSAAKRELDKLNDDTAYAQRHMDKYLVVKDGKIRWQDKIDDFGPASALIFQFTKYPASGTYTLVGVRSKEDSYKYSPEFARVIGELIRSLNASRH